MPGVLLNLMAACISLCHSERLHAVHSTLVHGRSLPSHEARFGCVNVVPGPGEKGSRSLRVDCWAGGFGTINRRGGSEIRGHGSRNLVVVVDQRYRRPPVKRAAGMADSE